MPGEGSRGWFALADVGWRKGRSTWGLCVDVDVDVDVDIRRHR